MRIAALALLIGLVGASEALAAQPARKEPPPPPAPELTEQAIDAADFEGWRQRREAQARFEAERKDARASARKKPAGKDRADAPAPPPDEGPKGPVGREPPDPFIMRLQILLDRAHVSPGAIDGHDGDNLRKAIRAYEVKAGLPVDGRPDPELWTRLLADGAKATKLYSITREDLKQRYVKKVPTDYGKLARLKWIGFTGPSEMLAERFHLDEAFLKRLNPGADFKREGETLLVPDVGSEPDAKIARIEVDRGEGELRAYAADGALVLAAPATIGSSDTPSPEGTMKVLGSFPNPHYVYDPKKNFQQGRNTRRLVLKPGPNGPVGSMWIDLSKPTYGIHGTPEPSKISKTNSHGCVRLTNWDAGALGKIVEKNKTVVEFR